MKTDPVCGMEVSEEDAYRAEVDGEVHYFCSEGCKQRFLDERSSQELSTDYDLIIIGGGPAGLTAAVYASMLKITTFVVAADLGGQAIDSTKVENYMGYDFITGPELIAKFRDQLIHSHYVDHVITEAETLERTGDAFKITSSALRTYTAPSIIVATGMTRRTLGVAGEEEFQRRGIFYGNAQDASFVEDESVAVIGGGNSAMQVVEALHPIVKDIHLVCNEKLTADKAIVERTRGLEHVHVYEDHQVDAIIGDGTVTGIRVRRKGTPDATDLRVRGVFVSVGLTPNSALAGDLVELNARREIVINADCSTSTPGLFAAGDVTSAFGKRIVIASGEGAKAALAVKRYLRSRSAGQPGSKGEAHA